jgi:hypothetical protein
MKTLFTEHLRRDIFADECQAQALECHEIAECNSGLIKEQYEALARQWMSRAGFGVAERASEYRRIKNILQPVMCVIGDCCAQADKPSSYRKWMGAIMQSRFLIKTIVVMTLVFLGVSAFGMAAANSAAERAWTVTQEALAKPFRSVARKVDFQFGEYQELRKVFIK